MRARALCGLFIAALMAFAPGCSKNPEVAKKRYLESGTEYMKKGKYQEARLQFRNALKVDARFAEGYY